MSFEIIQSAFEDVKECVDRVKERFEKIKSVNDFTSTPEGMVLMDAIAMRLQAIGEIVKNIDKRDKNFLSQYSQVERKEIMKLRDLISHHYIDINAEIIFKICRDDIPELEKTVDLILKKLNDELSND
jgi:uncharacterized protein with HEPN domain